MGYIAFAFGFAIFLLFDMGYNATGLQLPEYIYDAISMTVYAYFFGGAQAFFTGLYASISLAKYGKSSLRGATFVACGSTLAVVLALVVLIDIDDPSLKGRLFLFLLPPALISTIALHSFERYFRMPGVQAKS
ncbi:MAG: hypothetical protein ABJO09_02065 [Hyphomicrobiales bacterium]